MAWTAIVNPAAGRGRTERLLADLRARLTAAPVDVEVCVSRDFEDARHLALAHASAGRDLVACGGDGLVGLMAGVAAEHEVRLAIVPTGGGNDFAAGVGYDTKHPLDAVTALTRGADATVDLGRVNDTLFCGVTCSGFDAEANRWANGVERLSGTALYVAAVLRTLVRYTPQRFRVTVDAMSFEQEAWMVSVANNARYAGGMRIAPDARLDDGLLDVCIVGRMSRAELLRNFPSVFSGRHVGHPKVTMQTGRAVTVEALDSDLPLEVWVDGERVGPLPATITVVPDALRLRVPAGSTVL